MLIPYCALLPPRSHRLCDPDLGLGLGLWAAVFASLGALLIHPVFGELIAPAVTLGILLAWNPSPE